MSENSFRSPFAALIWKEWRESWWLLVLVLVLPLPWLVIPHQEPPNGFNLMHSLAVFTFWILAISLGAGLFAGERARGTAAFQDERPVRRSTIWNSKLLLPALTLLAAAILFVIAGFCVNPPEPWTLRSFVELVSKIILQAWLLPFTAAVLFSVLLDRPVTAGALAGVLSVFAFTAQVGVLRGFMDPPGGHSKLEEPVFTCLIVVEAIGLLWLSRVLYIRRGNE